MDEAQKLGPSERPLVRAQQELDLRDVFSVVVLDWDDTLFPTSAVVSIGPERLRSHFDLLDSLAANVLKVALSIPRSRVVLLTNANIDWVYHAAEHFFPCVNALLKDRDTRLMLVSACRPQEDLPEVGSVAHASAVAGWKLDAVLPIAAALQKVMVQLNIRTSQVIGVGDAPHDLDAARALSAALQAHESLVKTVLMRPRPSTGELMGQLRTLGKMMLPLSRSVGSFHRSMCSTPRPASVASLQGADGQAVASTPCLSAAASEDTPAAEAPQPLTALSMVATSTRSCGDEAVLPARTCSSSPCPSMLTENETMFEKTCDAKAEAPSVIRVSCMKDGTAETRAQQRRAARRRYSRSSP
eukprot:TRINITY_DN22466_c0_g1_i1.p1 TRINITY_DN22466_c0_g1~~TRINITY_DN22466_c0_g1_i1.p1  ORF type:complete len:407 (-),score=46.33 TRINITY_DN22466_c0_g1_i1:523-1593(-)